MGVDESFAEYVAARWSMLYRLAVLLVGEHDGDGLTQAALVKAYLIWPDVEEAASADDRVKAILAATAVHEPRTPDDQPDAGARAGSSQGDRLWALIAGLPPRQRAVLVLRHYERLTDDEIGHIVKASAGSVTAEAGALETGLDVDELRANLFARAEEVDAPLPPVEAMLARGRQARRSRGRRNAARAVGVAAVLAVLLGATAGVRAWTADDPPPPHRGAATPAVPQFISRLPRGHVPDIAYTERRFLHLPGSRGIPLDGQPAAVVQNAHSVFVAFLSGKIIEVDIATATVQTYVEKSGGQLVADPDGGQIAWLDSGVGPATVHLRSTGAADVTGTGDEQVFPVTLRCCDNPFRINGITQDGQLITSLPAENRAWVWDTRGVAPIVQEVSGMGNGTIHQVTPFGLVVQYPPFQYAVGQVEHGVFLQVAELAAGNADFSDPLGHRVVFADETGEVHVRERDSRGRRSQRFGPDVRMQLPTLRGGFAGARWEDKHHVLLDVYDASMPDGALVRCDVRTGVCELADDLEGPHLLPQ